MMRRFPWIMACAAVMGCVHEPVTGSVDCEATAWEHPRGAEYQAAMEAHCEDGGAPGCIMLVARADAPTWVGSMGFADLAAGTPMCPDTPFRIASITKPITASLVLGAVERGELALQDTLAELLPDIGAPIADSDGITLEHLLAHRSGLRSPATDDLTLQLDFFDRPRDLAEMGPEERMRRYVHPHPLRFAPGTAFRYSNAGYGLLGLALERAAGISYEQLLQREIVQPLGLQRMTVTGLDDPGIARGYELTAGGRLLDVGLNDMANIGPRSFSGGIQATARDVQQWLDALFAGEIVSDASRRAMHAALCDDPEDCSGGYGWGLYWEQPSDASLTIGHAGALIGVSSYAFRMPDEGATVVLFRNIKSDPIDADMRFLRQVATL